MVEHILPPDVLSQEKGGSTPEHSFLGRSWRFALRQYMGAYRWEQRQQQRRLQEGLAEIRREMTHSQKPILAYLVPFNVSKLQSGGGKRVAGIAKTLSAEFNVFILTPVPSVWPFSVVEVAADCRLVGIPQSQEFEKQMQILDVVRGAGIFAFPDFFDLLPGFHAVLTRLGRAARVWLFESPSAWPVVQRFRQAGCPVGYDAPNDYSRFLQNSFGCGDERLVNRMVALEREVLGQVPIASFCTMNDLAAARDRCPACPGEIMQIPNGVDVGACRATPPSQAKECRQAAGLERPVAIFVGAHHKPNFEAADWIVRGLAPVFPQVVFVVMGIHLAHFRESGGAAPESNVVFTGPVSEEIKAAVFALSDLTLAPMKSGTGSSLKIPEYIAYGKIVIGTPIGLRGFEDFSPFPSVLVAEDVRASFAQVLDRLSRDPSVFDRSCCAAREYVKTALDWSVVARPLVDALKRQCVRGRR